MRHDFRAFLTRRTGHSRRNKAGMPIRQVRSNQSTNFVFSAVQETAVCKAGGNPCFETLPYSPERQLRLQPEALTGPPEPQEGGRNRGWQRIAEGALSPPRHGEM